MLLPPRTTLKHGPPLHGFLMLMTQLQKANYWIQAKQVQ
jgi:hypothetical protein